MNFGDNRPEGEKASARMSESVDQALEMVQELTKEIRTTSYLLHPPLLDENGLPAALSWYIRGLSERSDLIPPSQFQNNLAGFPVTWNSSFFAWCRNALPTYTGTRQQDGKHSDPPRFERILIEVRDQGKGIPRDRLAR